jgi:hypothetical protein
VTRAARRFEFSSPQGIKIKQAMDQEFTAEGQVLRASKIWRAIFTAELKAGG